MEAGGVIGIFLKLLGTLIVSAWVVMILWLVVNAIVRHAVADVRRIRQERAAKRRGFDVISGRG